MHVSLPHGDNITVTMLNAHPKSISNTTDSDNALWLACVARNPDRPNRKLTFHLSKLFDKDYQLGYPVIGPKQTMLVEFTVVKNTKPLGPTEDFGPCYVASTQYQAEFMLPD